MNAQSDTQRDNARLMRLATYASVSVAAILIVAKFGAWLVTDSVAILSTLVDSLLDVAASLVNLFAVRQALQPADRQHRFGHGKAESLAALAQAAFISGSALFLLLEAGRRFVEPQAIANEMLGLAVMLFAIALTLLLVWFQHYVVARTGSVAIRADSLHYKGDVLVNGSVMISLVLSAWLGWRFADPIFAVAIACYILFSAWQITRAALDVLMDRELPDEDRARIRGIVLAHPRVRDLHDLRSRTTGTMTFIQLHLELDGELTLAEAHEISDAVEADIRAAYPEAEIIIHQDPEGIDEPRASFT